MTTRHRFEHVALKYTTEVCGLEVETHLMILSVKVMGQQQMLKT